jgi:hypothetical protein
MIIKAITGVWSTSSKVAEKEIIRLENRHLKLWLPGFGYL